MPINDDKPDDTESETGLTDIKTIVDRIATLEDEKSQLSDDISALKRDAFRTLKNQSQETEWTKKGLTEAFRLMRMGRDERNTTLTQASRILEKSGKGEIDLEADY